MNQLALSLPIPRMRARARRGDPQTSHDAAARVDAQPLADRVLDSLRTHGSATTHELAERLDLELVTVSPRMKPLEREGLVRRGGRDAGRTIWIATATTGTAG